MLQKTKRITWKSILIFILAVLAISASALRGFAQAPSDDPLTLFLPFVVNKPSGGSPVTPSPTTPVATTTTPVPTTPVPTTPVPTEPVNLKKAMFIQPDYKTSSASLAIDAQGGQHVAYTYYVPLADHPAAVYLYCEPGVDCSAGGNWNGVSFLDQVTEVQLKLTPDGQPRMLVKTQSTHSSDKTGNDFYYLACDSNCTDPNQWNGDFILYNWGTSIFDIGDHGAPQRYFELDHLGRPRFVYQDRNYGIEPDHYGPYYAWCDSDCTDGANWQQALIGDWDGYDADVYEWPSLTFTPGGQPRIVTSVYTLVDEDSGVYYIACDANCDQRASWQRVRLFERGSLSYLSWDIAVAPSGRTMIAFYKGDTIDESGDHLYFATCPSNCSSEASWNKYHMGLDAAYGQDPDLLLDAQGRPYLAHFQSGNGLFFAACDTPECASAGEWQHTLIDDANALAEEYPPALPNTCDAGFWDSMTPVIALDAQGNPAVAYDSAYETRCWYDDPNDNLPPEYRYHMLWHVVRLVWFPK